MSANLITALGALFTSVAALLTILELRRQRMAQYIPTIVLEDLPVRIYRPAKEEFGRDFIICPEGTNPSQRDLLHHHHLLRLRLSNVGAGPALDVVASWSFDELAAAACIAEVDPEAARGLIVEEDTVSFQADKHASWMADRVQTHRLGTLLSLPGNTGQSLWMPLSYLELLSVYLRALEPSVVTMRNLPMPPLQLEVKLRDRLGQNRQLRFDVFLRLHFLSNGGGPIPGCPGWENCAAGEMTVVVV